MKKVILLSVFTHSVAIFSMDKEQEDIKVDITCPTSPSTRLRKSQSVSSSNSSEQSATSSSVTSDSSSKTESVGRVVENNARESRAEITEDKESKKCAGNTCGLLCCLGVSGTVLWKFLTRGS